MAASPILADDVVSPTPSPASTALTEEAAAIAASLADPAATTTTPALPYLSQVNVGSLIPGVQSMNPDMASW